MSKWHLPSTTWIALGSYLLALALGVLIGSLVAVVLVFIGTGSLLLGLAGSERAQRQLPPLGRLPGVQDHGFVAVPRHALPRLEKETASANTPPAFSPPRLDQHHPTLTADDMYNDLDGAAGFPTEAERWQGGRSPLERVLWNLTDQIKELLRQHKVTGDAWLIDQVPDWAGHADRELERIGAGDIRAHFRGDGIEPPHEAAQFKYYLNRRAAGFRDALKALREGYPDDDIPF